MDKPDVSVILVGWNSSAYLPSCLDALASQTRQDFETIFVDNGSTDGSPVGLEKLHPELRLRVERLRENRGFAAACNFGIRLARGRWVALLNTDAFPEPDWLQELLRATQDKPEFSFFSSRQIQAQSPSLLDGAGDAYHVSGLAWRRYSGYPASQFGLEREEVFGACAAAALYLRRAFLQAGGFDEDFFSYHEDVDLSFRLRLLGHRCLYVPQAIVHHIGSATTGTQSDFLLYHWQRNYVWSFVKNMPSGLLQEALPAHLAANLINVINSVRRGHGQIVLKAKVDALRGLRRVMEQRRGIQRAKIVGTSELLRCMERGGLQPYLLRRDARNAWRAARIFDKK